MFHLGIITGLIDGLNLGGLIPVPCYLMCVRHNSCTRRLPFSNIVVLFYLCTEFSAHPFRGFLQDIYCTVYNGDLTASSPTIKFTSIDAKKKQIKMSNFFSLNHVILIWQKPNMNKDLQNVNLTEKNCLFWIWIWNLTRKDPHYGRPLGSGSAGRIRIRIQDILP